MPYIFQYFPMKLSLSGNPFTPGSLPVRIIMWIALSVLTLLVSYLLFHPELSFAGVTRLPGDDASDKLEAMGTLLKIIDTAVFKWGARLFAGLCIMAAAWALKEQRFGVFAICAIGAIIFGTVPKWVKNIFDIGDNQSLFSQTEYLDPHLASTGASPNGRAQANV